MKDTSVKHNPLLYHVGCIVIVVNGPFQVIHMIEHG